MDDSINLKFCVPSKKRLSLIIKRDPQNKKEDKEEIEKENKQETKEVKKPRKIRKFQIQRSVSESSLDSKKNEEHLKYIKVKEDKGIKEKESPCTSRQIRTSEREVIKGTGKIIRGTIKRSISARTIRTKTTPTTSERIRTDGRTISRTKSLSDLVKESRTSSSDVCINSDEDSFSLKFFLLDNKIKENVAKLTKKGKILSKLIQKKQPKITEEVPEINAKLKKITGFVTTKTFDLALSLYESIQDYYFDALRDTNPEKKEMKIEEIKRKLTQLEQWFTLIIEPKPRKKLETVSWFEREKEKAKRGISVYCNQYLKESICISEEHLRMLKENFEKLKKKYNIFDDKL